MAGLIGIFVLLPMVLYGEFERADEEKRQLVTRSSLQQIRLIADALRPTLDRGEGVPLADLNSELAKYNTSGMVLKLMFQPIEGNAGDGFYYVASTPVRRTEELDMERDELARLGILSDLARSCTGEAMPQIRHESFAGHPEVLTAVVPIKTRWGCWALVTAHTTAEFLNTAIGRPYWQTPEMRFAAMIYLVLALLAVLTVLSVRRNLRRFSAVARALRQDGLGKTSFAARNTLPELSSVAHDFDRLVLDLHNAAQGIRQAAEDDAHSFKAPIATIQSSLEGIRRALPPEHERAQRAVVLIDAALGRLRALVNAAQRLDRNTAHLIEAPRRLVDLTQIVAHALFRCRELMAERGIRLVRHLDENVLVRAGAGVLETAVENILDNAISFTPPNGAITVSLSRQDRWVEVQIDDEGPGIDPSKLEHIFERYFSLRPDDADDRSEARQDEPKHSGLGLWIVRRNVEALGGVVTATNRIGGGLTVRVRLPQGR